MPSLIKLINKSNKRDLNPSDVSEVLLKDDAWSNATKFENLWKEEVIIAAKLGKGTKPPSLHRCVLKFSQRSLMLSTLLFIFCIPDSSDTRMYL